MNGLHEMPHKISKLFVEESFEKDTIKNKIVNADLDAAVVDIIMIKQQF